MAIAMAAEEDLADVAATAVDTAATVDVTATAVDTEATAVDAAALAADTATLAGAGEEADVKRRCAIFAEHRSFLCPFNPRGEGAFLSGEPLQQSAGLQSQSA